MTHSSYRTVIIATYAALFTIMGAALSACRDDEKVSTGSGKILPVLVPQAPAGFETPDLSSFVLTLDDENGHHYTWPSATMFNPEEEFDAGVYTLTASIGNLEVEGYDSPYYYGTTAVHVAANATTEARIVATMQNVPVDITATPEFVGALAAFDLSVHAIGGGYHTWVDGEARTLYIMPGMMELYLHMILHDGRDVSVLVARAPTTAGVPVDICLKANVEQKYVILDINGEEYKKHLSQEILDIPGPRVTITGADADNSVTVYEGIPPVNPVILTATSSLELVSCVMTLAGDTPTEDGLTREIDLLNLTPQQQLDLTALGIETESRDDGRTFEVDVTRYLGNVPISTVNPTVSIIAFDRLEQYSLPVTLSINVLQAPVTLTSMPPVKVGSKSAYAIFSAPSVDFGNHLSTEISLNGKTWQHVSQIGVSADGANKYRVDFALPSENVSSMWVRFKYMGALLETRQLEFSSPDFSIEVDPYAHNLLVKVIPTDASDTEAITRTVKVYVNGKYANIYRRDEANGLVWVTGLAPETAYTVTATVFDNPGKGDFTEPVRTVTEGVSELPNPGFEETVEQIKYNGLPQGGAYSQSALPLYNRQNRADVGVVVPAKWANVNAKTFCTRSANPNTWYMQPSTMESNNIISGDVTVRLASVAFDPAGEDIPPYRQISEPVVPYNPNVPSIRYRAAGKLFLGSYDYDPVSMTEIYNEGIPFKSRPHALNGIYTYLPGAGAPDDCGRVDIEVLGIDSKGAPVSIAKTTLLLFPAVTPTTFSAALDYSHFGVKATALKVMLSSSKSIGTISHETSSIVTSPNVVNSSSTGSVLEIDMLTLSY